MVANGILGVEPSRLQAMAAGELTPDEASTVASVIETQRRAIETADHEERLKMLEAGMPK